MPEGLALAAVMVLEGGAAQIHVAGKAILVHVECDIKIILFFCDFFTLNRQKAMHFSAWMNAF